MRPIRVLIADDSGRSREGLHALLATCPEITVVGEAANGQEAVDLVVEYRPDVVLMDLEMPVLGGLKATQQIKQSWPQVAVVVLTMHITEQHAALSAGADAFVIKGSSPERLIHAIRTGAISGGTTDFA